MLPPGSGSAAAGALGAEFCFVKVGLLDAHVFPIDVEFVSDEHREMRFDTLADFGILAHDGDNAVSSDAQKCSRLESGRRGLRRLGKHFGDGIEMESDEDASACDG